MQMLDNVSMRCEGAGMFLPERLFLGADIGAKREPLSGVGDELRPGSAVPDLAPPPPTPFPLSAVSSCRRAPAPPPSLYLGSRAAQLQPPPPTFLVHFISVSRYSAELHNPPFRPLPFVSISVR